MTNSRLPQLAYACLCSLKIQSWMTRPVLKLVSTGTDFEHTIIEMEEEYLSIQCTNHPYTPTNAQNVFQITNHPYT